MLDFCVLFPLCPQNTCTGYRKQSFVLYLTVCCLLHLHMTCMSTVTPRRPLVSSDQYPTSNHSPLSTSVLITEAPKPATIPGYWLNRGRAYPNCQNLYAMDQCRDFAHKQQVLEKDHGSRVDLGTLLEHIACTLWKINCPEKVESFQIHDIACQSSCRAVVDLCARQLMYSYELISQDTQMSCPLIRQHNLESTVWSKNPFAYELVKRRRSPPGDYAQYSQPSYSPLVRQQRWLSQWNQYPGPNAHWTYPRTQPGSLAQANPRSRQMVPGRRTLRHPWLYSRSEQLSSGKSSKQNSSYFQTLATIQNAANYHIYQFTFNVPKISKSDCLFLPSGGCDQWHEHLQWQRQTSTDNDIVNPGCPKDLRKDCEKMFPTKFNRREWEAGGFTVASIIRISHTVWWFGKNSRFQPLVRFHVLKTLVSDIHPYDDKMILTYSWPSQCVCPGEITVGQQYLMLTHSFKVRQALNVTVNTVFLRKIRRFTKKLSCWMGSCYRNPGRNRHRRYPPAQQWYPTSLERRDYSPT